MNITKSAVDFAVQKELSQMQGNSYALEDITSLSQRTYAKPRLLTALLNPFANEEFLMTDTYKFDQVSDHLSLPSGKSYSDVGADMQKGRSKEYRYSVPSFGIKFNVAPQDYIGRRKPGSADEMLKEEDVVAKLLDVVEDSWSEFDELGVAQLITTDTNILRGGAFEEYNFYTDLEGGARPAKIDMTLDDANIDHISAFRKQRKLVQQELSRANDSARRVVCICGDTFFNLRYEIEKQESLARDLRNTIDLASMAIPEVSDGEFMYDNFLSHDGIWYVNYGAEIIEGTKLIADDDAYLIPMGAKELIQFAYAPAQTRQYANTQALQLYTWSNVDDRQGVSVFQESNKLFANKNPKAIRHLTTTVTP